MDVTSQGCSHTVCIFLSQYGVVSRLGHAAFCQGGQIHLIVFLGHLQLCFYSLSEKNLREGQS